MSTVAFKITSLTIVYSTVCSGVDQRKHQRSASLASVLGIHRGQVNSPNKRPVTRTMFPFDDVIMGGMYQNFLYCSIVWHFCSSHCSYKMEKIQKRALRVVLNDYQASYQDLLNEVSRPTLYVSRVKAIAIEMFKCVKNISPIFLKNMFAYQDQPYELRGGSKFIQPLVRTTSFGINSFRYEGTKIWNNLPQQIKNANDVKEFKQLIQQWSGPKCHCRNCILCNANNV